MSRTDLRRDRLVRRNLARSSPGLKIKPSQFRSTLVLGLPILILTYSIAAFILPVAAIGSVSTPTANPASLTVQAGQATTSTITLASTIVPGIPTCRTLSVTAVVTGPVPAPMATLSEATFTYCLPVTYLPPSTTTLIIDTTGTTASTAYTITVTVADTTGDCNTSDCSKSVSVTVNIVAPSNSGTLELPSISTRGCAVRDGEVTDYTNCPNGLDLTNTGDQWNGGCVVIPTLCAFPGISTLNYAGQILQESLIGGNGFWAVANTCTPLSLGVVECLAPGTASGGDNLSAPNMCATGNIAALFISGLDGDIHVNLSPQLPGGSNNPQVLALMNSNNYDPNRIGDSYGQLTFGPVMITEIPLQDRGQFSNLSGLRGGQSVRVCGRWVTDTFPTEGWNELHPVTSLSILTDPSPGTYNMTATQCASSTVPPCVIDPPTYVKIVKGSVPAATATVPGTIELTANCNLGDFATGGGYHDNSSLVTFESKPTPQTGTPSGWVAGFDNVFSNATASAETFVVCMSGKTGTISSYVVPQSANVPANGDLVIQAACNSGGFSTGGGFQDTNSFILQNQLLQAQFGNNETKPIPDAGTPYGWVTGFRNFQSVAQSATTFVVCMGAPNFHTFTVHQSVSVPNSSSSEATANCGWGVFSTGGGWNTTYSIITSGTGPYPVTGIPTEWVSNFTNPATALASAQSIAVCTTGVMTLGPPPPPPPTVVIIPPYSCLTAPLGSSTTATITLRSLNNFAGTITLNATSINGITVTPNPFSSTLISNETRSYSLTLNASPNVTPRPYSVALTGNGTAEEGTEFRQLCVYAKAPTNTSTGMFTSANVSIPNGGSVPSATSVYDTANVNGAISGFPIAGTVTYDFYTNGICSGTPTTSNAALGAPSPTFGPLASGSYSFQATYHGSDNYLPSTGSCESFSVSNSVGGTSVPVDKLTLLAPFIGLASILIAVTIGTMFRIGRHRKQDKTMKTK